MLNIDYDDPVSMIRSNVGDPNMRYVSDSTITSALTIYEGDIVKASVLVMESLLNHFSVQADESRTADVEFKYTKLFERYKSRLIEFKNENSKSSTCGIIIGGVELDRKNEVYNDPNSVTPWDADDWQRHAERRVLYGDKDLL